MKRRTIVLVVSIVLAFLVQLTSAGSALSQSPNNTQYQVTIASAAHTTYGLYYPVTYVFQIPSGSSNLTAQYRYSPAASWTALATKTATDFFNGINAARFDYANNTATISVAFALASDNIFLRVIDGQNNEVPMTFQNIPAYYDNRKAAVTISIDDWEPVNDASFVAAATILSGRNIHFTVAVITNPNNPPNWNLIQQWVNTGWAEVASHSRSHPCTASDYAGAGYDYQILGSKQDILTNLSLPYPYVPAYIEPCGYEDSQVRSAVINANYLITRGYSVPPAQHTFASWGVDGSYQRAQFSIDASLWPWYTQDNAYLAQANASFDTAYNANGIYHLVDHPWQGRWFTGSTLDTHSQYISNRNDVWYAGFGELYLYHYVQERGQVTVNPVGSSSPTFTPTPTGSTPTFTPTATNIPSPTATNTPTATLIPAATYSLWSDTTGPELGTVNDPNPVELGVQFRSDVNGFITGLRFYKGPNNTGTHIGHLWAVNGTLLGQVTFTGETAMGWQTANFASPIAITANVVYVASYHTDSGYFSMNQPYFSTGYYNAPLYAFGNSEVAGGNGVYSYGASAFPNQTYQSSNYWVDVIFSTSVSPTSTPTATFTPTATSTFTPTATSTNTPTATSTNTPTATSTNTPTATSTNTPTATRTNTPTATSTNTPTATRTNTPTATRTNTPTRTATPTPNRLVTSFTLVNADTNQDIRTLTNGETLNLATLPTRNLNIRANTNPATVGSVRFDYDGGVSYRIENSVPYALASNDGRGNYNSWTPTLGQHTLSATPFSGNDATGTAGTRLTISFTVVNVVPTATRTATRTSTPLPPTRTATRTSTPLPPTRTATRTSTPLPPTRTATRTNTPVPTQVVTSFTLVNADTNQDIRTLTNGETLKLATLPTRNLNIRANTSPATVGSVRFDYDGRVSYRIENSVPYALASNDGRGNYNSWTPTLGQHTLSATPFSGNDATGTAGTRLTISFRVVFR